MLSPLRLLPLASAAAVAAALSVPAPPAAAQGTPGGFGNLGMGGATRMRPPEETRRRAPPPGLPGLTARPSAQPIPAETDPQGLSPNDALFDGIARGDAQTVRDAVNRGADVNARNALGLTALDAAVDQGRPEITFYLLSVRGTAGFAPPPDAAGGRRGGPGGGGARGEASAATPPAGRGGRSAPAPAAREPSPPPAAIAAPRLPVLWSGNGGVAQPDIGFLGFDAGRPSGGPSGDRPPRRG